MMCIVLQNVTQRVPHLERRLQRARVIAVGKYSAATSKLAIDRSRDAHAQALKPTPQRPAITRFRDEMDMVPLDGVFAHAKAEALAPLDEGAMDSPKQAPPP